MDKGNSRSRYKGFKQHSLRMQTSNRYTTPFNRPTTPRINEYLPALPVELNLRGGNLESAVHSMYRLVDSAVGNTIGKNHPVISGALKLSASVIMMAGLAGMISGCAAGGNINNSQDENRYEHKHEHGNGLEHRGQHTGINGVSSLDECLLDEYLNGGSQILADSKVVSSKKNIIPETVNHKKELSTYLHKHFDLENADEILKSLPEDNYLETLELIKYAHDNLGLKSVDEYDLKSFSKLAEHNGLDLLKYAHTNCGLKELDSFGLVDLVDFAKNDVLVNHLKTKGKRLFDYIQTHLGLKEIHGLNLTVFTELAGHNGFELLKYAHENLGLNELKFFYLDNLAKLAKNNGIELLKYVHTHFGLNEIDCTISRFRLAESIGVIDVSWSKLKSLVRLATHNGLNILKYVNQNFELSGVDNGGLSKLVKKIKSVSFKKLKSLKEEYGINKVNSLSDLIKLSENIDSLDKKKVYLHKQYGITHFERYSSETIEQLCEYENPTDSKTDKRDVILYVMNKNDWNGAFGNSSEQIKVLQKSYRVIIYEVNNEREATNAVENTSKRIGRPLGKGDFVFLGGHGSKVSLNWGYSSKADSMTTRELIEAKYEHLYLDVTDEKELKELGKYVSEGSTIILDSCSAGEGGKDADNLANTVASCLPGRTVYAPKSPTKDVKLQMDDSGRIKNISFPDAETYKVTK